MKRGASRLHPWDLGGCITKGPVRFGPDLESQPYRSVSSCPLFPPVSPWAPVEHGTSPADCPSHTVLPLPGRLLRVHLCILSPWSDPGIQQVLSGCLVNECHKCPRNPELLHVSAVIACLPLSPYSLLLEDRAGSGTRKQTAGPPCNETPLCVEKHKLLIHTTNG